LYAGQRGLALSLSINKGKGNKMANMEKLIITAAICGAELTRKETPYLPITPEELSDEAQKCFEAGAGIVHLHVRDKEGKPSQNSEIFTETVNLIRKKAPKLIIQVSTGGAVWMAAEERLGSLSSKPDMATLTTGTCNFGDDVFMNKKEMILKFLEKMNDLKIMPEFECFDMGHISFANYLIKKELIKRDHYHFDFVMGVPGAINASVPNLIRMMEEIPQSASWTVAGIGRNEVLLGTAAIVLGGNVRVGMEDNLYLSKGILAKSNAELVEKIVRISREIGREIASPEEVKEFFKI